MRGITGLLLLVLAVALAAYVGLYVCLYGGIKQVIVAVTSTPVCAGHAALGVVRVLCTGLASWASIAVLGIPGVALIASWARR